VNDIKHPYYEYSLSDALSLATMLKKDHLRKELKIGEARKMASYTIDNLQEAIQILKDEYKLATFNWITGRVALEVLRAASGEENVFTT